MFFRDRGYHRGVELGPYPLEALPRDATLIEQESRTPPRSATPLPDPCNALARATRLYAEAFARCAQQDPAPPAPVPRDLARRSREIKGAAYYLDAAHAGICEIPANAWLDVSETQHHTHAIVLWIEFGRHIESHNLASGWVQGAEREIAHMRALEIGVSIVGHIRALGYTATAHHLADTRIDLDKLAVLAGVGRRQGEHVASPFFGRRFAPIAISTDYALATDTPIASQGRVSDLAYWWGINGAVSGRERRRQARRESSLSRYPMERVARVDRPTTLIFDDEVPRVPKRAEFFQRARMGDLGDKAQQEVKRFAFKHPLTDGMMYPLRAMVPMQDGALGGQHELGDLSDAAANADAIKSLSYHLGADLTGICEIPDYAWYSHGPDGKPIEKAHKYAVVMLIDQGYDTMEGASGDDWIIGLPVHARLHPRRRDRRHHGGLPARSGRLVAATDQRRQPRVADPAGAAGGPWRAQPHRRACAQSLVGPRFKSVVLTTDLPLVPDKPIDFGLQDFCGNCLKCARECPVNAIPFGDKVMFNGYEIWKPDVERCTRYRVTNPRGRRAAAA